MDAYAVLDLIRVRQWYKNLIVFAAAFFGGVIFNFNIFPDLIFLFFAFSFASGAIYCVNDIFDIESDKKHLIRKKRALACGKISSSDTWIVLSACIVLSLVFGLSVWSSARYLVAFILLNLVYSAHLKKIAYLDAILISTNFLIRALAGAAVLGVEPSLVFYLGIFFAGLFLVLGKRIFDLENVGRIFEYGEKSLKGVFLANAIVLVLIYGLFLGTSESVRKEIAIFSFPLSVFLIYHYYLAVMKKDERALEPVRFVFDMKIFIPAFLLIVLLVISVYL